MQNEPRLNEIIIPPLSICVGKNDSALYFIGLINADQVIDRGSTKIPRDIANSFFGSILYHSDISVMLKCESYNRINSEMCLTSHFPDVNA
jgi:hypothetical protein